MGNEPELQQCESLTNKGKRCTRKAAMFTARYETIPFLWIFRKQIEILTYYCQQHAKKAGLLD